MFPSQISQFSAFKVTYPPPHPQLLQVTGMDLPSLIFPVNLDFSWKKTSLEIKSLSLAGCTYPMTEKYMFKGAWLNSSRLKQAVMTAPAPMSHVKCWSFCIPQSAINCSCMTAPSALHISLCLILFPNSLQLLILKTEC